MPKPHSDAQLFRSASFLGLLLLLMLAALTGCGSDKTAVASLESDASAPAISPAGGTFDSAQTVTLTGSTAGASIYYTTDGSRPTMASSLYANSITVSQSEIVNAVALASGSLASAVSTATFIITPVARPAATPTISPDGGVYTSAEQVTLADSTSSAGIYYTTDGTSPTSASTLYTAPFVVSTSVTIKVIATAPGYTQSAVATAFFNIMPPTVAATPSISPAGGSFTSIQTVSIAEATAGATIYYTLDGTTPTSASGVYSSPISVSQSETIKAIGAASGFTSSEVAVASFTITVSTSLSVIGSVSFGKMALTGASVAMYSAGQTGYGSTGDVESIGLALTDASGNFSLSYSCSTASSLVYLISSGGEVAATAGTGGDTIVLMTALGSCGSLTGAAITVNEMTTVASAWSLAQFLQVSTAPGAARVGTSSTNVAGLANSFLMAANLVNPAGGGIGGPALPPNATLPIAEINTLADILASCAQPGSNSCSGLFQTATPSGGTTPLDVLSAAVEIARNPGNNVGALFRLLSLSAPWQPSLALAPTDWTLGVSYKGGGLNSPTSLALDAAGNVWVADYAGAASKFSPLGATMSPATGYIGGGLNECFGLTIDSGGNVWVTNEQSASSVNSGLGSVTKLSSTGSILSGVTGYAAGGLDFPQSARADANGNVWIANYGNSTATVLSATGAPISPTGGYGAGELSFPVAITVDATYHAWFANQGSSTITRINSDGTGAKTISCCSGPSGIAEDQSGNLWIANYRADSVSEVTSGATTVTTGYTGGGLTGPQGIAVDGAGDIWILNYHGDSLTKLQGSMRINIGVPVSGNLGFGGSAGLSLPYAVAIDESGNLWVSSFGTNSLVEYVGAAVPVKIPLLGSPTTP